VSRAVRAAIFAVLVLVFPGSAFAATSAGQPFPSNLFTVSDATQITGLHVKLPQPKCATNPSDCADVAVLKTLDGFNIQPRISIPFSAPIDLSTVSSDTVLLVGPGDHVVGINQRSTDGTSRHRSDFPTGLHPLPSPLPPGPVQLRSYSLAHALSTLAAEPPGLALRQ
jgi:hypothetical protein